MIRPFVHVVSLFQASTLCNNDLQQPILLNRSVFSRYEADCCHIYFETLFCISFAEPSCNTQNQRLIMSGRKSLTSRCRIWCKKKKIFLDLWSNNKGFLEMGLSVKQCEWEINTSCHAVAQLSERGGCGVSVTHFCSLNKIWWVPP